MQQRLMQEISSRVHPQGSGTAGQVSMTFRAQPLLEIGASIHNSQEKDALEHGVQGAASFRDWHKSS
eukprot:1138614-Pelagomonas_calceolata.AAC.4